MLMQPPTDSSSKSPSKIKKQENARQELLRVLQPRNRIFMSLIVLVVKVPTWRLIASYNILDPFPPRNPEIISHQLTCGLFRISTRRSTRQGWFELEHLRTVYLMASGQAIQCLHISHRKWMQPWKLPCDGSFDLQRSGHVCTDVRL